jgi:hypothetical protein
MLRAVLLIAITWTMLSFLFCFAWARALVALSDTRCTARGSFRAERPRISGLLPFRRPIQCAQASYKSAHTVATKNRTAHAERFP